MNEKPSAEGWYWFMGKVRRKITRRWPKKSQETICNVFKTKRGYRFPLAVFAFGDFYELDDFDGEWMPIESPWKNKP